MHLKAARNIAMTPTPDNLSEEAAYRYHERLGILCGIDEPTHEQHIRALQEAQEYDRLDKAKPVR
jgi:hypothetical protein